MTLREIQRPIKDRYVADPNAARITLRATGATLAGAMSCSIDIGRALYSAEAHPGVGGPGTAACSGDLLLGALAACAQLTCQMVAANMGVDASVSVSVEGDYFGWRKFDPDNEAACKAVEPLARSLNEYLPRFLKSRKAAA